MEEHMAMKEKSAVATRGGADGASLKKSIREEERKIEASKGSDLAKGAKRFEERSKSSDGKSAGAKQR
jgi:hypothetical protein